MRNIDEGRVSVVPSSQIHGWAGGQVPPLFTRLASSSAVSVNIRKTKQKKGAHHIPQPTRSSMASLLCVFSKETCLEQKDRVLADIFAAGLLTEKKAPAVTSCLSSFSLQCFYNPVVKLILLLRYLILTAFNFMSFLSCQVFLISIAFSLEIRKSWSLSLYIEPFNPC